MTDDDLIRRGDALQIINDLSEVDGCFGDAHEAISALPAVEPYPYDGVEQCERDLDTQPTLAFGKAKNTESNLSEALAVPEVRALVEAAEAVMREMKNNRGHVRHSAQVQLDAALRQIGGAA